MLRLVKLELKGSVQLKSKVKICIYIYRERESLEMTKDGQLSE